MEKTVSFRKESFARDAGYALFLGTGVLCLLSFLTLTAVALARTRLDSLERQSKSFYAALKTENEKTLEEWNGLNGERIVLNGEKSSADD